MRFRKTPQFDADLDKLPSDILISARKQFRQFKDDYNHPSLRVKKMQGYKDIWEGHVTLGYVFTFHWDEDEMTGERIAVFRRIGTHAVYKKP